MSAFSSDVREKMVDDVREVLITYLSSTSLNLDSFVYNDYHEDFEFVELLIINLNIVEFLKLSEILKKIKQKLRRDIELRSVDFHNQIKGKLDLRKYIQKDILRVSTKKHIHAKYW